MGGGEGGKDGLDPADERWHGFGSPALFELAGMGLDTEREIVQAEVVELEHLVGKEEGVVRLFSFREARHRWPLLLPSSGKAWDRVTGPGLQRGVGGDGYDGNAMGSRFWAVP